MFNKENNNNKFEIVNNEKNLKIKIIICMFWRCDLILNFKFNIILDNIINAYIIQIFYKQNILGTIMS